MKMRETIITALKEYVATNTDILSKKPIERYEGEEDYTIANVIFVSYYHFLSYLFKTTDIKEYNEELIRMLYGDQLDEYERLLSGELDQPKGLCEIPTGENQPKNYIYFCSPFEEDSHTHTSDPTVVHPLKIQYSVAKVIGQLEEVHESTRLYAYGDLKKFAIFLRKIPTSQMLLWVVYKRLNGLSGVLELPKSISEYKYGIQNFLNWRCNNNDLKPMIRGRDSDSTSTYEETWQYTPSYSFFSIFGKGMNLLIPYVNHHFCYPDIRCEEPSIISVMKKYHQYGERDMNNLTSWINEYVNMVLQPDPNCPVPYYQIEEALERFGITLKLDTKENTTTVVDTLLTKRDKLINPEYPEYFHRYNDYWRITEMARQRFAEISTIVEATQRMRDYLYAILYHDRRSNYDDDLSEYVDLTDFAFIVLMRMYWRRVALINKFSTKESSNYDIFPHMPSEKEAIELIVLLFYKRFSNTRNPFALINHVLPSETVLNYIRDSYLAERKSLNHVLLFTKEVKNPFVEKGPYDRDDLGFVIDKEERATMLMTLIYDLCTEMGGKYPNVIMGRYDIFYSPKFVNVAKGTMNLTSNTFSVCWKVDTKKQILAEIRKAECECNPMESIPFTTTSFERKLLPAHCEEIVEDLNYYLTTFSVMKNALYELANRIQVKEIMGLRNTTTPFIPVQMSTAHADASVQLFISYMMSYMIQ